VQRDPAGRGRDRDDVGLRAGIGRTTADERRERDERRRRLVVGFSQRRAAERSEQLAGRRSDQLDLVRIVQHDEARSRAVVRGSSCVEPDRRPQPFRDGACDTREHRRVFA
jgi:hypothetical protein